MDQKTLRSDIKGLFAERLDIDAGSLPSSLKQKDSAIALDVTTGTMDVWTCTGRYNLPFYKVGREKVYLTNDLVDFMLSRRVSTGEVI